jgi:putative permease
MKELFRNWYKRYLSDPQVIILAILLILGFVIIVMLGKMLVPVFAGIVIAFLLDGLVSLFMRCRIPRKVSVIVVFLVFMVCLVLLLVVFLPLLSNQIGRLFQELPSMIDGVQKAFMRLPERYPDFISEEQIQNVIGFLGTQLTKVGQTTFAERCGKSLLSAWQRTLPSWP